MPPASMRLAEQSRLAFAGRQQAGQHFHRRGLAAAVGADKAEDLAAPDVEIDMIDGGEIAEAAGQPSRGNDRRAAVVPARRNDQLLRASAGRFRQQGDEGVLDAVGAASAP